MVFTEMFALLLFTILGHLFSHFPFIIILGRCCFVFFFFSQPHKVYSRWSAELEWNTSCAVSFDSRFDCMSSLTIYFFFSSTVPLVHLSIENRHCFVLLISLYICIRYFFVLLSRIWKFSSVDVGCCWCFFFVRLFFFSVWKSFNAVYFIGLSYRSVLAWIHSLFNGCGEMVDIGVSARAIYSNHRVLKYITVETHCRLVTVCICMLFDGRCCCYCCYHAHMYWCETCKWERNNCRQQHNQPNILSTIKLFTRRTNTQLCVCILFRKFV